MKHQPSAQLWAYESGTLPGDQAALTRVHLNECAECRALLESVRSARETTQASRGLEPQLNWSRVDARVRSAVGKALRPRSRWPALAFAAAAVLLVGLGARVILSSRPALPAAETVAQNTVQAAVGGAASKVLGHVGVVSLGNGFAVETGHSIEAGATVVTGAASSIVTQLPDQSLVSMTARSRLRFASTRADHVDLVLDSGEVAVRASHEKREAFTVHAGNVTVSVVGTVFSVKRMNDGEVDVTVAEGRVRVERAGAVQLVSAGTQLRVDASGEVLVAPMDLQAHDAFRPVFEARPVVDEPVKTAPAVEAEPLVKRAPVSRDEAVRGGEPVPAPHAIKEEPLKAEEAPSAPAEPVQLPPPPPATAAEPKRVDGSPLLDAETAFLQRAERGVIRASCSEFMLGLEELATDAESPARAEQARILRARCFSTMHDSRSAQNEYRKYLQYYPDGSHIDEARRFLRE